MLLPPILMRRVHCPLHSECTTVQPGSKGDRPLMGSKPTLCSISWDSVSLLLQLLVHVRFPWQPGTRSPNPNLQPLMGSNLVSFTHFQVRRGTCLALTLQVPASRYPCLHSSHGLLFTFDGHCPFLASGEGGRWVKMCGNEN